MESKVKNPVLGKMTIIGKPRHFFSRGGDSLMIDLRMHAHIRHTLISRIIESKIEADAVILAGGGEVNMYDSDTVWDFRQESNFQYLFGVKEPGCFGLIKMQPAMSVLFVPRFPQEYAQWFGPIKPTEWFKETYLVDQVYYVDEMETVLGSENLGIKSLLYYDYMNQDSGVQLPVPNNFKGSDNFKFIAGPGLANIINEMRLIKTDPEIQILQYTNDVTCRAHIDTMKSLYTESFGKVCSMEHFAETNFRFRSGLEGCARVGYNCIACSGINNAILHYGHAAEPNNDTVQRGSLRLIDMGAEYHCYTADVTVTFPTNGKFTDDQKTVYEAVLAAVEKVESTLAPGIDYKDMHRLSHRVMLEELVRTSDLFLTTDVDELVRLNICSYFSPHGLGHSLGLMVHDVAIEPGKVKEKVDPTIKGLRLQRVLEENMVLTVEPGIYFIEYLMDELASDPARSKLINFAAVERCRRNVGGVRIEDNVVITADGCRVLTDVPRKVGDIEAVMRGEKDWKVGDHYRTYKNH